MTKFTKIPLSRDGSAWIKVGILDEEHRNYIIQHFETMFNMHPDQRAKVAIKPQHNDLAVHRWQRSYGNTPEFNDEVQASYMFSSRHDDHKSVTQDLPSIFHLLRNQAESITNQTYNQFVVNWYLNADDYIAMHSDYCHKRSPNTSIVVMNMCPSDEIVRRFTLKRKSCAKGKVLLSSLEIPLFNGTVIEMGGTTQEMFRHGVPKNTNGEPGPRISLTLRNYL